MNPTVLAIFSAFALLCENVLTYPVKYDQRQEGDLNVRTDVEDVVFVVVPPQDLITAGMGLVAATAADLLRKNYGTMGVERWPVRTPPKLGFVPLEKSPYKIDLEKSGVKVKKISQIGDPNRYNFNDGKNPAKGESQTRVTLSTETPEKSTMEAITMETLDGTSSTTENKTVKKVLKPEEIKKGSVMEDKKNSDEKKENPAKKAEGEKIKTDEKISEGSLKVVGEGTKDGLDPSSLLRIEGCGPDARRDSTGKCVYMTQQNSSN